MNSLFVRGARALLYVGPAIAVLSFSALAASKPPLPPIPELAPILWAESFDVPFYLGAEAPGVTHNGLSYTQSWSGYALVRSAPAVPFSLPGTSPQGVTLLPTTTGGALRFWFKPDWTTGIGPRVYARLAEINVAGVPNALWSLQIIPDGSALSLIAQTSTGPTELLNTPIAWSPELFHLVSLNFDSTSTRLFLDGWLVAEGRGILSVPPALATLTLGSTATGAALAGGQFEDAFSFGRPLDASEVAAYYNAFRKFVSGWASLSAVDTSQKTALSASGLDATLSVVLPPGPGEGDPGTNNPPGDPGPAPYNLGGNLGFLALVVTASNLTLIITNIDPAASYDLYYTTNMGLLLSPNLCATNWAWLARTSPGQTNFTWSSPPQPECYFILGTSTDSDHDGLPDAYELLVNHSSISAFDFGAIDGIPAGWLVASGLNPLESGISSQDNDSDGLSNFHEYLWGTDPLTSEPLQVWIATPNASPLP